MASRKCDSLATLKYEIEYLQGPISQPETEESWDTIARAVSTLTALCNGGACDFESELVNVIRSFYRPLNNAMNSERTKLSGATLDLITALASGLGPAFEPLLHLFFPTLLTLCTRTNKVFLTRARACIFTIIESTQSPALITYFSQSIKDKATTLRLASTDGVFACLNCFNPPDLEKEARAREIEAIIRATARDANADVRKGSRKIFDAYKILLPNRVDRFTEPLSPTMKKYLNITSKPRVQPDALPRLRTGNPSVPDLHAKARLSSSTSALNQKPPTHDPSLSDRTHAHGGGASTTATRPITRAELARNKPRTEVAVPVPEKARAPVVMPPPEYIPVRPIQPPQRPTPAVRADIRSRTTSTTQASRFVPAPSGATVGGARRVKIEPAHVPSVPATIIQATRPQRPMVPAMTDGPVRPTMGLKSDRVVPAPCYTATTGARRVPIAENQRPERRPVTRSGNTSVPASRPESSASTKSTEQKQRPAVVGKARPMSVLAGQAKAHEMVKSTANPVRGPLNDANDKPRSDTAGRGTVSRNTGRAVAAVERKAEVTKPAWGQQVPRQTRSATTKLVINKLVINKKVAAKDKVPDRRKKVASGDEKKEKTQSAEAPPPKPAPRTPTPTQARRPPPSVEEKTEEKTEDENKGEEEKPVENQRIILHKPSYIAKPPPLRYHDEATYLASLAEVGHALRNPPKTPISILLSSIEDAFFVSPRSPLSPPGKYINGVRLFGAIPFGLQNHKILQADLDDLELKKKKNGDLARIALNDVQVNKLV